MADRLVIVVGGYSYHSIHFEYSNSFLHFVVFAPTISIFVKCSTNGTFGLIPFVSKPTFFHFVFRKDIRYRLFYYSAKV